METKTKSNKPRLRHIKKYNLKNKFCVKWTEPVENKHFNNRQMATTTAKKNTIKKNLNDFFSSNKQKKAKQQQINLW